MIPDIRDMPYPAPLAFFRPDPIARYRHIVDLRDAHVLLIGYSDAQALSFVQAEGVAAAVRLTLWADHVDVAAINFEVQIGDISQKTSFPDHCFDAVVFSAVFEHLHDLEGAFFETSRILRPGGLCISEFGPVWEGAVGHHLYLDPGHPVLDFQQRQLPSHMHLLYDQPTVRDYLIERGVPPHIADQSVEAIYSSPVIGRIRSKRYFTSAADFFDILVQENFTSFVEPEVRRALRARGHLDLSSFEGGFWCMTPKQP